MAWHLRRPVQVHARLVRSSPLGLLIIALGSAACSPPLVAHPQWVQWLSYRQPLDMAVSSDGDIVAVGHTTSDEATSFDPYGQSTWRPWITRISGDGRLLDDWTGFHGYAHAVAVDDEGGAYVVLGGLRDDQDWSTPERCELRALDRDGQVRWSQPWSEGECPVYIAVAGDAVVVAVDDWLEAARLEAFGLDGRPRWRQPLEALGSLAVVGDTVWMAPEWALVDPPESEAVAWRVDARDGHMEAVRLDLEGGRFAHELVATVDGLLVSSVQVGFSYGAPRFLTSFTFDGRRRWDREVVPRRSGLEGTLEEPTWVGIHGRPVADGRDAWLIGTEQLFEPSASPGPSERYRMMLQRWSADGAHGGTLHKVFEDAGADMPAEADPATFARSECPTSDIDRRPVFGSLATHAFARPNGTLFVVGQQGCRDGFVLGLEVER